MSSLSLLDTQTPQVLTPDLFTQQLSLQPLWGRLYSRHVMIDSCDLSLNEFSLGRAKESTYVIKKNSLPESRLNAISKLHFIISRDDECTAWITDYSRNGTFINGERIKKGFKIILKNDDDISISSKELIVFTFKMIQSDIDPYLPLELRNKYDISKQIGKGACGEVKLMFNKYTNDAYAVKKILKERSGRNLLNDPLKIKNEVEILQKIDHPFVIAMKEIIETDKAVFIVLDYLKGGELTPYIERGLNEYQCKFLFYQMVLALEYLHKEGIIHRDLKPENILLKDPHPDTVIKITDFGLSKIISGSTRVQTICGTLTYVAPEVLDTKRNDYNQAVDVWSLGVVLYYMLSQNLPFSGERNELIKKILCNKLMFNSFWVNISCDAKDLLREMLNKNPDGRITITDIIKHPFITKNQHIVNKVHECFINNNETFILNDSDSEYDVLQKRIKLDERGTSLSV